MTHVECPARLYPLTATQILTLDAVQQIEYNRRLGHIKISYNSSPETAMKCDKLLRAFFDEDININELKWSSWINVDVAGADEDVDYYFNPDAPDDHRWACAEDLEINFESQMRVLHHINKIVHEVYFRHFEK